MKTHKWLFFFLLLFLVSTGCSDENEEISPIETEEGSWVKYSPVKWTHDGNPVEGTFCKVYSDGAIHDVLNNAA